MVRQLLPAHMSSFTITIWDKRNKKWMLS
jgi:hypothetical protein